MTKLKLGDVTEDRSVRVTIELPANVHRDLTAYAEILGKGQGALTPQKLIAPMITKFMATDREFRKARKKAQVKPAASG